MTRTMNLPDNAIGVALMEDDFLTRGVLLRRCAAWWIDLVLIGLIDAGLGLGIAAFGVLTLGLGWAMLPMLAAVPFLYHWLFLSALSATPGQSLMGLAVRRNADMALVDWVEAGVWTLLYYATLAVFFPLLLVALFTARKRALHDSLSGLVVIRKRALTQPAGYWNMSR